VRREEILRVLPAMSRAATTIMFLPALARDLGPGSPARRFARLRDQVDALILAELADRRGSNGSGGSGGSGNDILSLLLEARDEDGRGLTDLELRDELMTLLFAGHETTATALAWALDLVLHDPAAHARLASTIAEGDFAYLDAAIKEVHRARPTVPNVVRRVQEPLELGPWRLPAGAVVSPAVYLVHRRPDLYPDPHAFRPERFLDARTPSYTWLPFGGGIRRCLGAAFATLEMEEVLKAAFGRLSLRPADPERPETPRRRTVTSVPARGTRVVVDARS
jgi:cytochrome P450